MEESENNDPIRYEQFLARTFKVWREEFRNILEDHRREIQVRLEKIEREIEQKSDKENVELVVGALREDMGRNIQSIRDLYHQINAKMNTDVMWKVVGLVLTVGSIFGGLIGFLINLLIRK